MENSITFNVFLLKPSLSGASATKLWAYLAILLFRKYDPVLAHCAVQIWQIPDLQISENGQDGLKL